MIELREDEKNQKAILTHFYGENSSGGSFLDDLPNAKIETFKRVLPLYLFKKNLRAISVPTFRARTEEFIKENAGPCGLMNKVPKNFMPLSYGWNPFPPLIALSGILTGIFFFFAARELYFVGIKAPSTPLLKVLPYGKEYITTYALGVILSMGMGVMTLKIEEKYKVKFEY